MSKVDRFWSHEAQNIRCVRESDYDRDVNAWQERALTAEAKQAQQGEPNNCERDGHLPIGWGGPVFCELCSARLPDEPALAEAEQPAAVDWQSREIERLTLIADRWQTKVNELERELTPHRIAAGRALFAPAAVVMPERMTIIPEGKTISYAAGYEDALGAVARLNRNTVSLELLEQAVRCLDEKSNRYETHATKYATADQLRAILGANCGSIDDLTHDSDCSTNNHGCPDLLGSCDCSLSEGAGK